MSCYRLPLSLCLLLVLTLAAAARAQFDAPAEKNNDKAGVKFGPPVKQRWKVGMIINSPSPCMGVYGTVPVFMEWPGQSVKVVDEEFSLPTIRVDYRNLEGGARQMLISIPAVPAGQPVSALVTFEISKCPVLGPDDPSQYAVPKRLPRDLLRFLGPSPAIETAQTRIKTQGKEIAEGKEGAWQQVEAIYDWVREHVEYKEGKLKGAFAALKDGHGDCEELTSLFIAFCRVNKIPARAVWVPGHCYPEFYLEDKHGHGHWFPCQAAGTRDFGSMPDTRPILQKGDNFKVPEKEKPQRYVAEYLKIKSVAGNGDPKVKFVRQLLPSE